VKFKLEIECDNDAFEGEPVHETARILHVVAGRIRHDGERMTIKDINGSTVGWAEFTDS
jgi:hypothetical protein